MKTYSNTISLIHNSRGIYSLDTTLGCSSGLKNDKNGCYGDCYAAKSAKIYGYDFSKTILRSFESKEHRVKIINEINKVKLDFIRIGTSGDPSEDWCHTIEIIKQLTDIEKQIVIITKHWTNLNDNQIEFLSNKNVVINTSISALDEASLLSNSINQYHRLKPHLKSVLRIVSAKFNTSNQLGNFYDKIQNQLFKNENTLDTVLRVNKNNPLVLNNIIETKQTKFLGSKTLASKMNKKTYFSKCSTCLEMCGLNIGKQENIIKKQLTLF